MVLLGRRFLEKSMQTREVDGETFGIYKELRKETAKECVRRKGYSGGGDTEQRFVHEESTRNLEN